MSRSKNLFAALDSDEDKDEDSDQETELLSKDPVAFSIKDLNWKVTDAIYRLRQFKIQNISGNKSGVLFLRFVDEKEAQNAFRYMRQKLSLKFTSVPVPLLVSETQRCFHCHKQGHWGSECYEGQFSTLPVDLIRRISTVLGYHDLFSFMHTAKLMLKIVPPVIRKVDISREPWRRKEMTFKVGYLKHCKNLQHLTVKSIRSKTFVPVGLIAKMTQLKSLSLVAYSRPHNSESILTDEWLNAIGKMTMLHKLDLEALPIDLSKLGRWTNLAKLTQLRVSKQNVTDNESSLDPLLKLTALKKFSLDHRYYYGSSFSSIPEALIARLHSLKLADRNAKTLPDNLPNLRELDLLRCNLVQGLAKAPNLTKLKHGRQCTLPLNNYSRLVSLTLQLTDQTPDLQLPNLTKLVVEFWAVEPGMARMNLNGLINLAQLTLISVPPSDIYNVPDSLTKLVVLARYGTEFSLAETWAGAKIKHFELLADDYYAKKTDWSVFISNLERFKSLEYVKLEHLPEEGLPYLERLAHVKVIDLVNHPLSMPKKKKISEDKIIALSAKLPNTRIMYGYKVPTMTKRECSSNWKVQMYCSRNYIVERCSCCAPRSDNPYY